MNGMSNEASEPPAYGPQGPPIYRPQPQAYQQPPPYQQTPNYPQQGPAPQQSPEKKTNVLAILSLIFAFLFSLLGLIFGIIALVQIGKNPYQKGKGLAIAGIILSLVIGPIIFLIMLGSLAYFQVLSPSAMLPNRCMVGAGFDCTDYRVNTDGTVNLNLRNNLGLDIQTATLTMGTDCTPSNTFWGNGQTMNFVCKESAGKTGASFSSDFTLNYLTSGGAYQQTIQGSLSARYG